MSAQSKTIFHKSAGAVILYPSGHDLWVALLKKKTGQWVLPKGHVEKNETSQQAALREAEEELGINGSLEKLASLGANSYTFRSKNDKSEHFKKVHFFAFLSRQKEKLHPLSKENFKDARWFKFDKSLELITYPSERKIILKTRRCETSQLNIHKQSITTDSKKEPAETP